VSFGVNIYPIGQSSPLGAKLTPGGKTHPWEQTMLLKTGLWLLDSCDIRKGTGGVTELMIILPKPAHLKIVN
jgi:hypothetical protein